MSGKAFVTDSKEGLRQPSFVSGPEWGFSAYVSQMRRDIYLPEGRKYFLPWRGRNHLQTFPYWSPILCQSHSLGHWHLAEFISQGVKLILFSFHLCVSFLMSFVFMRWPPPHDVAIRAVSDPLPGYVGKSWGDFSPRRENPVPYHPWRDPDRTRPDGSSQCATFKEAQSPHRPPCSSSGTTPLMPF